MKTPLPPAARLCAFLFVLTFVLVCSPLGRAEWIILQIPLARAGHQFTFWEPGSTDSVPLVLAEPADQMGYDLGAYSRSPSGPPLLEGGTFDGNGVWHPGGSAYATISAFRQATGTFFLRDQDTMEFSLPGQTDLLYTQWQTINAGVPVQFVAIGEDRHDHLLSYVYGNLFIPLTNGAGK